MSRYLYQNNPVVNQAGDTASARASVIEQDRPQLLAVSLSLDTRIRMKKSVTTDTYGNRRSIFSYSRDHERSRKRKSREPADGLDYNTFFAYAQEVKRFVFEIQLLKRLKLLFVIFLCKYILLRNKPIRCSGATPISSIYAGLMSDSSLVTAAGRRSLKKSLKAEVALGAGEQAQKR